MKLIGWLMLSVGLTAVLLGAYASLTSAGWELPVSGGNGRRIFQVPPFLIGAGMAVIGTVLGIWLWLRPRLNLATQLRREDPSLFVLLAQTTKATANFLAVRQRAIGNEPSSPPVYVILGFNKEGIEVWGRDAEKPLLRVPLDAINSVTTHFVVTSRRVPAVQVDAVIEDETISLGFIVSRRGWEIFPIIDMTQLQAVIAPLRELVG